MSTLNVVGLHGTALENNTPLMSLPDVTAGLAVTVDALVGLDVESLARKPKDPLRLARRRFCQEEMEDLLGMELHAGLLCLSDAAWHG